MQTEYKSIPNLKEINELMGGQRRLDGIEDAILYHNLRLFYQMRQQALALQNGNIVGLIGPGAQRSGHGTQRVSSIIAQIAALGRLYSQYSHNLDEKSQARRSEQSTALVTTSQSEENRKEERDYYAILNIVKDASMLDVRRAYRKLALELHPDKNPDPMARLQFEKIQRAYLTLSDPIAREKYDRKKYDRKKYTKTKKSKPILAIDYRPTYLNEKAETFLSQISVYDIPKDRFIELDGYAFDAGELEEYVQNDLFRLYKNPHIIDRSLNQEFSDTAKVKLRNHPLLGKYAKKLDEQLFAQKQGIDPETIDAVIKMLNKFHTDGYKSSEKAIAEFIEHKLTLSPEKQKILDDFIIEIPTEYGGKERFTFAKALHGGDNINHCIISGQIYLWQFVVTLRPSAISLVPKEVHAAAAARHFKIGPLSQSASQSTSQSTQQSTSHSSTQSTRIWGMQESTALWGFTERQLETIPFWTQAQSIRNPNFHNARINERAEDSSSRQQRATNAEMKETAQAFIRAVNQRSSGMIFEKEGVSVSKDIVFDRDPLFDSKSSARQPTPASSSAEDAKLSEAIRDVVRKLSRQLEELEEKESRASQASQNTAHHSSLETSLLEPELLVPGSGIAIPSSRDSGSTANTTPTVSLPELSGMAIAMIAARPLPPPPENQPRFTRSRYIPPSTRDFPDFPRLRDEKKGGPDEEKHPIQTIGFLQVIPSTELETAGPGGIVIPSTASERPVRTNPSIPTIPSTGIQPIRDLDISLSRVNARDEKKGGPDEEKHGSPSHQIISNPSPIAASSLQESKRESKTVDRAEDTAEAKTTIPAASAPTGGTVAIETLTAGLWDTVNRPSRQAMQMVQPVTTAASNTFSFFDSSRSRARHSDEQKQSFTPHSSALGIPEAITEPVLHPEPPVITHRGRPVLRIVGRGIESELLQQAIISSDNPTVIYARGDSVQRQNSAIAQAIFDARLAGGDDLQDVLGEQPRGFRSSAT